MFIQMSKCHFSSFAQTMKRSLCLINFINLLTSSFYARRSQKRKKTVKQLFVLSGSARVKAERKNNDEIDPCYLSHFSALLSPKEHEY